MNKEYKFSYFLGGYSSAFIYQYTLKFLCHSLPVVLSYFSHMETHCIGVGGEECRFIQEIIQLLQVCRDSRSLLSLDFYFEITR